MANCYNPRGCDDFFGARFARKMARRYRKRGLDKTTGRMVAYLQANGLDGATVLEVGGGVGEIEIELLQRDARSAVNLELSPPTKRKPDGSWPKPASPTVPSAAYTTSHSTP